MTNYLNDLKPTYDELRSMYIDQCEVTDNWAKKYNNLKAQKCDPRIKDLENQLRRANETITWLNAENLKYKHHLGM